MQTYFIWELVPRVRRKAIDTYRETYGYDVGVYSDDEILTMLDEEYIQFDKFGNQVSFVMGGGTFD